jgi:peroxiredoxin
VVNIFNWLQIMIFAKKNIIYLCFILIIVSCNRKNEDFVLTSTDNNSFELKQISNKRASVFVFLSDECPLSQNYTMKINELANKYSEKNIQFYCVFPHATADNPDVKKFKRKYKLEMPCLADPEKELTDYLDATITPEAFVLDADKTILYSGRIDNWASSLGVKRQVITSDDLDNVLNDIVNNNKIIKRKTEAIGCLIE